MNDLIAAAESLAPLFRETADEAERTRRPLDRVIDAVRASGLYAMMVPESYSGAEADLDAFFETTLILSRADTSMGWLTAFFIEHNLWLLNFPAEVCDPIYAQQNYALAPAALNVGAGMAKAVDGGYRLSGQWQWGTGITHSQWVLAGGLAMVDEQPTPMFFLMPIEDVEPIDTWHVTGMCATGSWDFKLSDVFIPTERAVPFMAILDNATGIAERFAGPLYRTPLMPVLGFAAGLPILGAAQAALAAFTEQQREKRAKNILRAGTPQPDVSQLLGEASLRLEAAELTMRDVLRDVMSKRNTASKADRDRWLSRQAFAVHSSKEAVRQIADATGASGGYLHNPIQRCVRDISMASNHVVFSKDNRYGDIGRALLGIEGSQGRS